METPWDPRFIGVKREGFGKATRFRPHTEEASEPTERDNAQRGCGVAGELGGFGEQRFLADVEDPLAFPWIS
jgi:hypothetical protein